MSKRQSYQSEALEAIHQTISDMFAVGVVDQQTMDRFDDVCLERACESSCDESGEMREYVAGLAVPVA
ncbi:MAG: hypothetical protein HQL91_03130 [Magnetococcales bacterium]|nr:hypothetical protein [Magnetococcales bacterium]